MSLKPIILTLPGRFSSGPDHWQSIWEAQRPDCSRIELGMWDSPQRNGWVNNINHAVRRYERPVFIAAHGLACIALAWWAALENPRWQEWIVGALLVAPTEAPIGSDLESFGPTPRVLLPFPSILVASQNDPKVPFDRAQQLSRSWGSEFVSAGEAGHINACSNLGSWDFGQTLLSSLLQKRLVPTRSSASRKVHLCLTDCKVCRHPAFGPAMIIIAPHCSGEVVGGSRYLPAKQS